jgi:hypothetical protein
MLTNVLNTSLKGYSDTRWTSKARTVKALCLQTSELCKALNDTVENMLENLN